MKGFSNKTLNIVFAIALTKLYISKHLEKKRNLFIQYLRMVKKLNSAITIFFFLRQLTIKFQIIINGLIHKPIFKL